MPLGRGADLSVPVYIVGGLSALLLILFPVFVLCRHFREQCTKDVDELNNQVEPKQAMDEVL